MFFPEGHIRVYLYGQPVDMRKSYDGLYALARHGLNQDPTSGHLFVFVNRRATQMKVLYFDRSGWCLWAKRLEAGRFISDWSQVCSREMDWTALKLMLEGIEVKRRLKRYAKARNEVDHSANNTATSIPLRHADRAAPTSAQCR
jgi:transposase